MRRLFERRIAWSVSRRARQIRRKVFRHVHSYRTFIEPFGYSESFVVASNQEGPWNPSGAHPVEERLALLYQGDFSDAYSDRWHDHLFALPPHLARRLV